MKIEVMSIFGMEEASSLDKKVADPAMTLENNPLAGERDPLAGVKEYNMRRLREDAHRRACPVHGQVYSAIMDVDKGGN